MPICANCGQENPEVARFCLACGGALTAEAPREERKVVTVLFADLVGFTSRAEHMDPEDVRALLLPYYARLRAELERFGGTVEKFIGDAVMALFGAPIAHEDDPERAVRAALAIRDWVVDQQEELQVRIAVTTGEALVALGARPTEGEGMASGDVVNTAARLQATAPVNGILVDETTHRATKDAIIYHDADPVEAKGKVEPVAVYQAIEPRARVGVERGHDVPLVGRSEEVGVLVDALARAKRERSPQLVTVVGLPGIGKSRLVYELFGSIEKGGDLTTWRHGRALPYGEAVTFWPLAEMVKAQAGILESDSAEEAEAKLRTALTALDPPDPEWVEGHLRPLAGLGGEGGPSEERRGEAFAAWRRFFEVLAELRPLVLVFEDLHWADDGVLDFVDHLVEWASGVAILVVCTARPELLTRRPGWGGGKPNATTISLSPLSDEQTAILLGTLLQRAVLPVETQTTLLAVAGGNPLYAEQYARMLAETGRADELALPETVQGIIAARLDALSTEEKALLQDAAVVGRTFWLGAIRAIGGLESWAAEERIHALERKEFVQRERRSSVGADTEYTFRHLLVRDVAYGQIPRGERADKHVRAAEWIESLGRTEDHAEMLAHHWLTAIDFAEAAGRATAELAARAGPALRDAGDRAAGLQSYGTAAVYYGRALELWPEEHEERPELLFRHARALALAGEEQRFDALEQAVSALESAGAVERTAEAHALLSDAWWLSGSRERTFEHLERALDLMADRPPSEARARVFATASRRQFLAGALEEAIPVATEALQIAEALGLPEIQATALNTLGLARSDGDDPGSGRADLERSVEIGLSLNTPDVIRSLNNLAHVVFSAGDFPRAREFWAQALQVAEQLGSRQILLFQQGVEVWADWLAGEWAASLARAEVFIAECEAGSPHYMEASVREVRAEIRLAREEFDGAVEDVESALALAREAGDPQALLPALGVCASIYAQVGRIEEARAHAEEVIAALPESSPMRIPFGVPPLIFIAEALGIQNELLEKGVGEGKTVWHRAFGAAIEGDFVTSADAFEEAGSQTSEAAARLRAAKALIDSGRRGEGEVQLARALAFYRSVGATFYVRQGEELLAATA